MIMISNLEKVLMENNMSIDEWDNIYLYSMISFGINIAVRIIVLFGANIYNVIMVGLGVVWTFIYMIMAIYGYTQDAAQLGSMIVSIIWNSFIIYVSPSAFEFSISTSLISIPDSQFARHIVHHANFRTISKKIHVVFINEVNKGIMSPETYPCEEYSCCCA